MSSISLTVASKIQTTVNYDRVFRETIRSGQMVISDTIVCGRTTFKVCQSINFDVAKTLQVSEKDRKDIFDANLQLQIGCLKYAIPYANHKEISILDS